MWRYISSYWSPLTTCHSQDLGASSQYVLSTRHISLKILSRTFLCIFQGIHVELHLKLLEPTDHMSHSRSWCILSICRILETHISEDLVSYVPRASFKAFMWSYISDRSPAEILGLNPTGGMDICLL